MGRTKKEATIGDNLPVDTKMLQKHVEAAARCMDRIVAENGKLKDILNSAKEDGFLKRAIRKALKNLRMTEEQLQAQKEVETATEYYTDLCSDLPLFAKNKHEEEEEAA